MKFYIPYLSNNTKKDAVEQFIQRLIETGFSKNKIHLNNEGLGILIDTEGTTLSVKTSFRSSNEENLLYYGNVYLAQTNEKITPWESYLHVDLRPEKIEFIKHSPEELAKEEVEEKEVVASSYEEAIKCLNQLPEDRYEQKDFLLKILESEWIKKDYTDAHLDFKIERTNATFLDQVHRKQEEMAQKKKEEAEIAECITRIKRTKPKIEEHFKYLNTKIGQIDRHHFAEAQETASKLIDNLRLARKDYEDTVQQNPRDYEAASKIFLNSCESSIKNAMPVLERDLGWGTYLQNLLKNIANAFISIVSICRYQNFFQPQRATSAVAVTEFNNQLKTNVFN